MNDNSKTTDKQLHDEPGLSSAMHDIRSLARSYQISRQEQAPEAALELDGVSMTPNFILQPHATSTRDGWKAAALTMMVLLGLSTSVLAMKLFADGEQVKEATIPLQLELDASHLEPVQGPATKVVFAAEPSLYQVSSLPGSSIEPAAPREIRTPSLRSVRDTAVPAARKLSQEIDSCDEVACLIDASDACCQAFATVRGEQVAETEVYRPYRPTRSEIMSPLKSIHGRVESCFDRFSFDGVATVDLVISTEGRISSFELGEGSPEFQSCVERQVRALEFPKLSQPFHFSYPFLY